MVSKWCLHVAFVAATPAIDLIQAKKKYPFLYFLKMKPCAKNGFGLFLEKNGDLQIHLVFVLNIFKMMILHSPPLIAKLTGETLVNSRFCRESV